MYKTINKNLTRILSINYFLQVLCYFNSVDLFITKHKIFWPFFIGKWDFSISDFAISATLLPLSLACTLYLIIKINQKQKNNIFITAFIYFYELFHEIFYTYLKDKGVRFIPFLFSLMLFIFILNVGNMIPIIFPCSSQLALTLTLSILVFILVIFIGIVEHKWRLINFFIPKDVPLILKPFLFILEILSFLIRPISLALRLAINMIAGHVMMHVISSFSAYCVGGTILSGLILGCIGMFELGIAALQAYIFAILSCIYIADILYSH